MLGVAQAKECDQGENRGGGSDDNSAGVEMEDKVEEPAGKGAAEVEDEKGLAPELWLQHAPDKIEPRHIADDMPEVLDAVEKAVREQGPKLEFLKLDSAKGEPFLKEAVMKAREKYIYDMLQDEDRHGSKKQVACGAASGALGRAWLAHVGTIVNHKWELIFKKRCLPSSETLMHGWMFPSSRLT